MPLSILVFLVAAAALLCCAAHAIPAEYFVSSSKGADSNSGESAAAPWQSLTRALQGVAPGDSLYLRAGDIWNVSAPLVLTRWGSGVRDGSLPDTVLGLYLDGQSDPNTPRPWVRRAAGGAGPVLICVDCAGLAVRGLEVSGGEQGLLFSYSEPSPFWGAITVSDCFIHDIRGLAGGGDPDRWGTALGFNLLNSSARTDVVATNISILGNIFNASDVAYQNCITAQTHGFCVWPNGGVGGYVNLDGVVFSGNLVNHVAYNAAFFAFTRNTRIAGNTWLDNVPLGLFPLGTTDIIFGEVDASVSFVDNEIANRGEFVGGPDGCGVDLEDSSAGVVLSDNYISRTVGAGIMLFAGTGAGNKNISLLRNTLLLDGCNQSSGDHGVLAFLHAGQTGLVADNVLAACPGKAVFVGDTSGFTLRNNTVLNGSAVSTSVVATPIVAVQSAGTKGSVLVSASCSTPGATLHYTVDGSRPTGNSDVWPTGGVEIHGRATAVLVKAFGPGLVESAVAGGTMAAPR